MVIRVAFVVLLSLSVGACFSYAQGGAGAFDASGLSSALFRTAGSTLGSIRYYHSISIRRFINSFTSYQFPNPFPPQQDPLSRLEFPIDQWFAGIKGGFETGGWSFHCRLWKNVSYEGALRMQDSDWDDETMPFQKTIFSESKCRLNRGLILDVSLDFGTPVTGLLNIRPVIGYRYQDFYFTTHDGFQSDLAGRTTDLPGEGIDFEQLFYHYYAGGVLDTTFDWSNFLPGLSRVQLIVQVDFAGITAKNEDLHLLRLGERITTENTRGHCWHVYLSAGIGFRQIFYARVEGDFKRIITNGSHELTNRLFGIDFSFDGSRVWSDQGSVAMVGEIAF